MNTTAQTITFQTITQERVRYVDNGRYVYVGTATLLEADPHQHLTWETWQADCDLSKTRIGEFDTKAEAVAAIRESAATWLAETAAEGE